MTFSLTIIRLAFHVVGNFLGSWRNGNCRDDQSLLFLQLFAFPRRSPGVTQLLIDIVCFLLGLPGFRCVKLDLGLDPPVGNGPSGVCPPVVPLVPRRLSYPEVVSAVTERL